MSGVLKIAPIAFICLGLGIFACAHLFRRRRRVAPVRGWRPHY